MNDSMHLHEAANLYWKRSQHYQGLKPEDRNGYVELILKPEFDRQYCPAYKGLLGRIIGRHRVAA